MIGISGFIELTALGIWGFELIRNMLEGKKLRENETVYISNFQPVSQSILPACQFLHSVSFFFFEKGLSYC